MLAHLLAYLPAWITGRIQPLAEREVRTWTRDNLSRRTLQYGLLQRLLFWGREHPVLFCTLVALTAAVASCLSAAAWDAAPEALRPAVSKPRDNLDIAAFIGVPWTVQATLVALVYPIVVSFIALMLQRKAHSTVALRVYVLESGMVPAGASSIALLIELGALYLATPYSSPEFLRERMTQLLIMNALWLLLNVLLTGVFLGRTIRFVQEEEQRHSYTRIAVDVVFRAELIATVKQHILIKAPRLWGYAALEVEDGSDPKVRTFALAEGAAQVTRDLKARMVLHDVHTHMLRLVAATWSRRARRSAGTQQQKGKTPTLVFSPRVGVQATGAVILCSVANGPPLTRLERGLVKAAFLYRGSRQGTMSLTTRKMLEEIGGEIEAAAEQQRFAAATGALLDVLRLHKTLLLASIETSVEDAGSAATVTTTPYSWSGDSFDMEWLKPYRDVGRVAVDKLDWDGQLFGTLTAIPSSIVHELPPRPERLLINAQLIGTSLMYHLGRWWTRHADASLPPGATAFSGTLPAPMSKVYEGALTTFIGSWGHLKVRIPKDLTAACTWRALTARAEVYATHIENSARLLLNAVSRGDEAAATWLLENFLKWWGNRQSELECWQIEGDFRVRHATLCMTKLDWPAAQAFLWDGKEDITIEFATKAISRAIGRYWESMRLFVTLLLIQNAGATPSQESRELRCAAALITGVALRPGGRVEARPLDSIDAALKAILADLFGIESTVGRIDAFAESLRWNDEAPVVPGWIYSWSGSSAGLGTMRRAQAILLAALAGPGENGVSRSRGLVERWWKDVNKLNSAADYCASLNRELLSGDFEASYPVIGIIQGRLKGVLSTSAGCVAAASALSKVVDVARHERSTTLLAFKVNQNMVRDLARAIAAFAFDPAGLPYPIEAVEFRQVSDPVDMSFTFSDIRQRYLEAIGEGIDEGVVEHIGEQMRHHQLHRAFRKRVEAASLQAVNAPALRQDFHASQATMQAYLSAIAARCDALRASGQEPIVLVGRSAVSSLLSPSKWGEGKRCPLPPGIGIGPGDAGALAFIGKTPVFEFGTPFNDCYVVPASTMKTLLVVGADSDSALSLTWADQSVDLLTFSVSWKAGFDA